MEEYSTKYSAYNAKEDYNKAQIKILKSKRFQRIFNRLLKKIRKAANRGEKEYWWTPLKKDIITQRIYNTLENNDFRVWTNNVGYTIRW